MREAVGEKRPATTSLVISIELPALKLHTHITFAYASACQDRIHDTVQEFVEDIQQDFRDEVDQLEMEGSLEKLRCFREQAVEHFAEWQQHVSESRRLVQEWKGKVDRVTCLMNEMRDAYFREVDHLREQLYQQDKAYRQHEDFQPTYAMHFDPCKYTVDLEVERLLSERVKCFQQELDLKIENMQTQHDSRVQSLTEQLKTANMRVALKEEMVHRLRAAAKQMEQAQDGRLAQQVRSKDVFNSNPVEDLEEAQGTPRVASQQGFHNDGDEHRVPEEVQPNVAADDDPLEEARPLPEGPSKSAPLDVNEERGKEGGTVRDALEPPGEKVAECVFKDEAMFGALALEAVSQPPAVKATPTTLGEEGVDVSENTCTAASQRKAAVGLQVSKVGSTKQGRPRRRFSAANLGGGVREMSTTTVLVFDSGADVAYTGHEGSVFGLVPRGAGVDRGTDAIPYLQAFDLRGHWSCKGVQCDLGNSTPSGNGRVVPPAVRSSQVEGNDPGIVKDMPLDAGAAGPVEPDSTTQDASSLQAAPWDSAAVCSGNSEAATMRNDPNCPDAERGTVDHVREPRDSAPASGGPAVQTHTLDAAAPGQAQSVPEDCKAASSTPQRRPGGSRLEARRPGLCSPTSEEVGTTCSQGPPSPAGTSPKALPTATVEPGPGPGPQPEPAPAEGVPAIASDVIAAKQKATAPQVRKRLLDAAAGARARKAMGGEGGSASSAQQARQRRLEEAPDGGVGGRPATRGSSGAPQALEHQAAETGSAPVVLATTSAADVRAPQGAGSVRVAGTAAHDSFGTSATADNGVGGGTSIGASAGASADAAESQSSSERKALTSDNFQVGTAWAPKRTAQVEDTDVSTQASPRIPSETKDSDHPLASRSPPNEKEPTTAEDIGSWLHTSGVMSRLEFKGDDAEGQEAASRSGDSAQNASTPKRRPSTVAKSSARPAMPLLGNSGQPLSQLLRNHLPESALSGMEGGAPATPGSRRSSVRGAVPGPAPLNGTPPPDLEPSKDASPRLPAVANPKAPLQTSPATRGTASGSWAARPRRASASDVPGEVPPGSAGTSGRPRNGRGLWMLAAQQRSELTELGKQEDASNALPSMPASARQRRRSIA